MALSQFQRREADDPCPYFAVLWPACLVLAFPTLLPDLNEAPVEDSAEATPGDRQIAAGMKQVAESLHLEGGHSAACGVVDASMSQASLEVGARSADVSEECARPQLCAASRVHSEPAAPPLSCQGNAAEAGEQSLGAVDVVSTRPSTEQSFVEPTAMVLEPSKSITPPAEAPSEMTCHHLIDTVPDAKFEGTAQVAGEPLELTVRSGRLRRPRSMRMRSGHGVSWHNRRLQLSGPPALRTESLHRPPETKREAGETQLVIQTRGKKRRLAEATAGGEKLGPDGVVRPECVLQASPRKKRTRVVFTEPGGARPNANKSGGLGSGVGLEGEGKERSSVEESGLAGTGKVKQESDASEVAGEWRHNGSGERSEKRRPVAWLVPFKRRSEERTRALCTDSPPPASEPYTAGTPDASQGIPPDIPPPAADVRPLCDGATPPVSWPATPEKVRPSRPQMSPLPPAAGAAARSVRGLERVRDGDPGERTRGTATPETTAESPCKCSTCCCGEAGTVFVTLLVSVGKGDTDDSASQVEHSARL